MYGSEVKRGSVASSVFKTQNTDNTTMKLQEDLETLQFRIYQLTGVKPPEPISVSSSFISGLKTEDKKSVDSESFVRLSLLEKILLKTNEFDIEVLKKTASSSLPEMGCRKSISSNLFCLPSHLLITDRLLDLFKQSQRANSSRSILSIPSAPMDSPQENLFSVLSASDLFATSFRSPKLTPLSSSSDLMLLEEKHKNATLRAELDDSVEQLSTTTHLLFTAQVAAQDCKNDVISLQGAMARTNSLNKKLKETIKQQSVNALSVRAEKSDEDLQFVKDQLLSMEKMNNNLQERLDIEIVANQNIRNALMAAATNLNNNEISLLAGSSSLVSRTLAAFFNLHSSSHEIISFL